MSNQKKEEKHIDVATDAVIFTVRRGELCALLIQMKKVPYAGKWAFPGGRIDSTEPTEKAARRILAEQTGVRDVYLEQLATFDDPKRDVLGRVVSVAYMALIPDTGAPLRTTNRYADVRWWSVKELPRLAYDHDAVAKVALERLRAKLGYSNVAWSLLPEEFTLSELQAVYEAILGIRLDKRNFRKKVLGLGVIVSLKKKRMGARSRPAELYGFKDRKYQIVQVL